VDALLDRHRAPMPSWPALHLSLSREEADEGFEILARSPDCVATRETEAA
jgi:hypothetical protein